MQKIWQQPFPSPKNNKNSFRMSAIAGLCVFAVLFFLKPFGIAELSNSQVFIIGIEYAFVTIIFSLFCNILIPYLIPKLFEETNWTVLKEIIFLTFIILVVAIGNILFTIRMSSDSISASLILNMLKYTLIIGIIPVAISVLIKQQQLLKKYSKEAAAIKLVVTEKTLESSEFNQENSSTIKLETIEKNETEISENILLEIKGSNYQEILKITPSDFLFAQASDNYTAIHYLKNEVAQKVLYRTTIKNVETQTELVEEIFRCHKSYLVNLAKVTQITGNAQGYKLHLGNYNLEIPVSRNFNSTIKQKFAAMQEAK